MKPHFLNRNTKTLYIKYLRLRKMKNLTEKDKDNLLNIADILITSLVDDSIKNTKLKLVQDTLDLQRK